MPRFVQVAALGLTALFAQAESAPPTVAVFMHFDREPAGPSVDAMEREVDDLLRPSGIVVNWRLTNQAAGETYDGLVVLEFTGVCRADPSTAAASEGESLALGSTRIRQGRVLPFSEIRCDEVRKALAFLPRRASGEQRQAALGRAMARVVAHELYHVLARTATHAGHGLAKARHPMEDLVSNRAIEFQALDAEAMRKGLASPPR